MPIERILVVDDSATQRLYLADLLARKGFTVLQAENGDQALEKVRLEHPDLVLMDVVMPGFNGFQATRAIARDPETRHIPVILCTTKDQETDRIWGMRQGAQDYLVKPINVDELLTKIASLSMTPRA